jgi:hypothetical protein
MATWKIESMIVKPQDGTHTDVVMTANWRCNASSGDFYASNYGSAGFTAPGDSFIPYGNLTESDVLNWCWSNGVDKDAVEANVQRELDALINPPVVNKTLPWVGE